MRLAFFSPLPPAPTGIADYAAEVLALLAPRHVVVAVHDQDEVDEGRLPCAVLRAGDFGRRAGSFDAIVYQLGNGPGHDFVYPWLARAPGLLVLHDLVLHHASRMLMAAHGGQILCSEITAGLLRRRGAMKPEGVEPGVRLVDETPRVGAGGCRVAVVHPKAANGVLVELKERER